MCLRRGGVQRDNKKRAGETSAGKASAKKKEKTEEFSDSGDLNN